MVIAIEAMLSAEPTPRSVDVRTSALAALGIAAADLIGGTLLIDSISWRIKSVVENGGELRLILLQED